MIVSELRACTKLGPKEIVSPDGRHFLALTAQQGGPTPLTVVIN